MVKYERSVINRFNELGLCLNVSNSVRSANGCELPEELSERLDVLFEKWSDEFATAFAYEVFDYIREVNL